MSLKWGIVGAGKICNDFATALRHLPFDEHEIVAVAARSKESSTTFAKKHHIPLAYDSYDKLALDKSVEIVYIGSINPTHYEIAKMMLEHGKHVLCEKPMCLIYKHTEELITLARKKKLFLMEAVWSRCFPAYDYLRTLLADNSIGEILYIRAEFGLQISEIPRIRSAQLGGGTVFDLGVYVLQLAMLIFGSEPTSVQVFGNLNEECVDENVDYLLNFSNGKTANLSTHSKIKMDNCAIIYGTKGQIKLQEPFWCPTVLITCGEKKEFPLPFKSDEVNFLNSEGLLYEATEVKECLLKGLIESPKMNHTESLAMAKIQEKVCKLLGSKVIY